MRPLTGGPVAVAGTVDEAGVLATVQDPIPIVGADRASSTALQASDVLRHEWLERA
jgi:hypothetical protein